MTSVLDAVQFEPTLLNPSPSGLFGVTQWTDTAVGDPARWLAGVQVRPINFGGEDASGVWGPAWTAAESDLGEDDVKDGERPELPDQFDPITVWAYDECDLTMPSQAEVRTRAAQNLRLQEQFLVEDYFAARLLDDAGSVQTVAGITTAVSLLESMLGVTNTLGFLHAGAHMAAYAQSAHLIVRTGTTLRTPMGHTWVFGGGYSDSLRSKIVATSPTFGWRSEVAVRDTIQSDINRYAAVAERSLVVCYEQLVGVVGVGVVPDDHPGADNYPGEDNYPGG